MSDINFVRGLSNIPDYVEKAICKKTLKVLTKNGFGISFPNSSGLQMRCVIEGVDFGGFYSYKVCGGIAKAIAMAMSKNLQLQIYRKKIDWSNTRHVSFSSRLDKRKGKIEYRYSVGFKREDKPATKSFFIGYDNVTTDQMFHTYRTAMIYKWYLHHYGEHNLSALFKNWKKVRIYDGFTEFTGFNK